MESLLLSEDLNALKQVSDLHTRLRDSLGKLQEEIAAPYGWNVFMPKPHDASANRYLLRIHLESFLLQVGFDLSDLLNPRAVLHLHLPQDLTSIPKDGWQKTVSMGSGYTVFDEMLVMAVPLANFIGKPDEDLYAFFKNELETVKRIAVDEQDVVPINSLDAPSSWAGRLGKIDRMT